MPISYETRSVYYGGVGAIGPYNRAEAFRNWGSTFQEDLSKHNLRVVPRARSTAFVRVDFGRLDDPRTIYIDVFRDGRDSCTRLHVPDRSLITMILSSEVMAEVIARTLISPPETWTQSGEGCRS